MDVFSLRDSVIGEYRKFATSFTMSFTMIHAEDIRAQVEAIYPEASDEDLLLKRRIENLLVRINPSFRYEEQDTL